MTQAGIHSEGFTPELKTFCSDLSPFTHITGAPPTDLSPAFFSRHLPRSVCRAVCIHMLALLSSSSSYVLLRYNCQRCCLSWDVQDASDCVCVKSRTSRFYKASPNLCNFPPNSFFYYFFAGSKILRRNIQESMEK